jgi:hypothetical protein
MAWINKVCMFFKKIFSIESFQKSLPWLSFFGGIILVSIGLNLPSLEGEPIHSFWKAFCNTVGITILSSGIFSVILKTIQFSGVFKEEVSKFFKDEEAKNLFKAELTGVIQEEISEIIFNPKFLKLRNDLAQYWVLLTKELTQNKFPEISDLLLEDIKNNYLPLESGFYFKKANHTITLKLLDKEKGIIEYNKNTRFTIVAHDETTVITYPFSTTFKIAAESIFNQPKLKINDKIIDYTIIKEYEEDDERICEYEAMLVGHKEYTISKDDVRSFQVNTDPLQYYKTTKILKDLNITIVIIGDIKVEFESLGTLKEIKTVLKSENTIQYEYKGILYPEQGYLLHLKLKN